MVSFLLRVTAYAMLIVFYVAAGVFLAALMTSTLSPRAIVVGGWAGFIAGSVTCFRISMPPDPLQIFRRWL